MKKAHKITIALVLIASVLLMCGFVLLTAPPPGAVSVTRPAQGASPRAKTQISVQNGAFITPVPKESQYASVAYEAAHPSKAIPSHVSFPRFSLSCEIIPVGLDKDDRMAVAKSHKIATWYKYGASPGQPGNAILASHVRYAGKDGFFSILPQLEMGEEVLIGFADGSQKTFEVTLNEFYYLEEMPDWVMNLGGKARVTLITCAGRHLSSINDSEARTIVLLKEKK